MYKKAVLLAIAILPLTFVNLQARRPARNGRRSQKQKDLRTLVNLLDYIGKDYAKAISNGKVIIENEYNEMLEFSEQVSALFNKLNKEISKPKFAALESNIKEIRRAIEHKANTQKISEQAGYIRQQLLSLNLISVIPPGWPDLDNGKEIFSTQCKSCHGKDGFGNGPLAKNLRPSPSNFHDSTLASQLSPLQAYNTIRLGIEGTAMTSYTQLSDQEVWDVAFYINALRYNKAVPKAKKNNIINALKDTVDLKTLATVPNKKWMSYLGGQQINVSEGMSVLRSMDKSLSGGKRDYLDRAVTLLHRSFKVYKNEKKEQAIRLALDAYLKGVEPVESQVKATNPSLVYRIENQMIEVRSLLKEETANQKVQQKIEDTVASIHSAQDILEQEQHSFFFTYLLSASILLREGLEAFLIILVILGVLKSVGAKESIKYVHGGWLLALFVGIISWFFAEHLLSMSPIQRELMEGIGSFIAVGLLLYIGFWLHDKTHVEHWKEFVQDKIQRLINQK